MAPTLDMLLSGPSASTAMRCGPSPTRHKLGGPVLVVDKDDDLRSLINISGGEATSDGNVYTPRPGQHGLQLVFLLERVPVGGSTTRRS